MRITVICGFTQNFGFGLSALQKETDKRGRDIFLLQSPRKAKGAHLFRSKNLFSPILHVPLPARAVCFFFRVRQSSLSVIGLRF